MTKNIEGTVTELSNVISVNELLKEAFGEGTKGNYIQRRPIAFFETDERFKLSDNKLYKILKKSFFGGGCSDWSFC